MGYKNNCYSFCGAKNPCGGCIYKPTGQDNKEYTIEQLMEKLDVTPKVGYMGYTRNGKDLNYEDIFDLLINEIVQLTNRVQELEK